MDKPEQRAAWIDAARAIVLGTGCAIVACMIGGMAYVVLMDRLV